MQRPHQSLLIGLIGSAIGFAASFAWYNSTAPIKKTISKNSPIAVVENAEEESRKRPVSRMFWMDLSKGDSLYSGEVIETTSQSHLMIRFLNSDRIIEIEPSTLLVLQGTKDELNIDLIEGGLFVTPSTTQNYEKIDINSSQGKIDLSKASATISGSSNGKINLQVLRGEASLKNQTGVVNTLVKGKNIELSNRGLKDQSSEFSLYYPSLDKPQYVTVGQTDSFTFKWDTNQSFNSYKLLMGEQRKNLKEHPISEIISNKEFKSELPPGKHYFKIVSTDPNSNFESPLYRIDIKGLKPPTLTYPESNSVIDSQNLSQGLNFKWTGTEEFVGITFELATTPQMSPILFKKETNRTSEQILKNLAMGTYYVRLTGRSVSSGKLISSKIISFTINNQPKQLFKAPLVITWLTPSDDTKIFYPTVRPEANMSWNASNLTEVTQWQVRIAPEGIDLQNVSPQTTQIMQWQSQLTQPGRYIAMIEGLNDKNQIIGKSSIRKIEYQPMPPLNSPQINPPNTSNLIAGEDGVIDINWSKVTEATQYQVSIKDQNGKIQNFKTSSTTYRITQLAPGQYTLDVQAIDENARMSAKLKSRRLIVPEPTMLMAPVIKKIKVN